MKKPSKKSPKTPKNPKPAYPLGIVISKDNGLLNFGQTVDVLGFDEFSDSLTIVEHGSGNYFSVHYTEIYQPSLNSRKDYNDFLSYHEQRYHRNRPVVIELSQTCSACPSQWEGKCEDGRFLYIQYRNGWFRAEIYPKESDFGKGWDKAKLLLKLQKGPKYDGYMTKKEMKELLKDKVNFDSV